MDIQELCDRSFTDNRYMQEVEVEEGGVLITAYDKDLHLRQKEQRENRMLNCTVGNTFYMGENSLSSCYLEDMEDRVEVYNLSTVAIPQNKITNTNIVFCFNDFFGKKVWIRNTEDNYILNTNHTFKYQLAVDSIQNGIKNGLQKLRDSKGALYFKDNVGVAIEMHRDDTYWNINSREAVYDMEYVRVHLIFPRENENKKINLEIVTLIRYQVDEFLKQLVGTEAECIYDIYQSLIKNITKLNKKDVANIKLVMGKQADKYLKPIVANVNGVIRVTSVTKKYGDNGKWIYVSPNMKEANALAYVDSLTHDTLNYDKTKDDFYLVRVKDYYGLFNDGGTLKHVFVKTEFGMIHWNHYSDEQQKEMSEKLNKQINTLARLKGVNTWQLINE